MSRAAAWIAALAMLAGSAPATAQDTADAPQATVPEPTAPATASALMRGIVALARLDHEVDLDAVERELRLPGLAQRIEWHGPSAHYEFRKFFATYRPPGSELGISLVVVDWERSLRTGAERWLTFLQVDVAREDCPSARIAAEASGAAVDARALSVSLDGRSFAVPAVSLRVPAPPAQEASVLVTALGDGSCRITVMRDRD